MVRSFCALGLLLFVAAAAGLLSACRTAPPPADAPPATQTAPSATRPGSPGEGLNVVVSILPQAYFVEQILGSYGDVSVLVGPGQSPHSFEPTPQQVAGLAKADVLFRIGVTFEEGLIPRLQRTFPNLNIVDTREGVPLRKLEDHVCTEGHEHEHEHHEHGEHDDHGHAPGGDDPHIWLSPKLVKIQARTITRTLAGLDPAHAAQFEQNLAAFEQQLDELDQRLATALAPLRGREVFVYHPAFGYLLDDYGLRQAPVELGGKEPTPRDLAALIEKARAAGAKVIFVQPQFSAKTAETLARQIGGVVVPLDPLARNYIEALEEKARLIKEALDV